jgi:hypothetical protein
MPSTTAKTFIAKRGSFDPFGSTPEQQAQYREMARALDEEARENWDNPAWHRQVAADLATSLDYGFTFNNLFGTYFRVQNVGEFDRVILKERRGLRVYYTARGGWIDETQLRTEQWEMPRDTIGFHVSEMEDKLRAGFAETISTIVNLAEQRLDAEVNRRILTTLQTAVPAGSPYYVDVTGGLTDTVVNRELREVKDAIRPNGEGPVPVTILGRAAMIDQLLDFDYGFAPETNEEIRRLGRLGTYRGANLVTLVNFTDEDGQSYFPANELWIFGGDVGRFAMYGPMLVKTWTENNVDYVHYRARKDIGGLVHHSEMSRRLVDPTAPA